MTTIALLVTVIAGAPTVTGEGVDDNDVALVQAAVEQELDARKLELAADASIVVRPGPEESGGYLYQVEIDGERVVATQLCEKCNVLEVGRAIVTALEEVGRLQPVSAEETVPPPTVPPPDPTPAETAKAGATATDERRANRLLAAGVTILVVGGAGAGFGGASFDWSHKADRNRTTFRNAGIAGMAIGGAAVVAGATIMGIAIHALTKSDSKRVAIRRGGGLTIAF